MPSKVRPLFVVSLQRFNTLEPKEGEATGYWDAVVGMAQKRWSVRIIDHATSEVRSANPNEPQHLMKPCTMRDRIVQKVLDAIARHALSRWSE